MINVLYGGDRANASTSTDTVTAAAKVKVTKSKLKRPSRYPELIKRYSVLFSKNNGLFKPLSWPSYAVKPVANADESKHVILSNRNIRNRKKRAINTRETIPDYLNFDTRNGFGPGINPPSIKDASITVTKQSPLYAMGWGWNADGRAGNGYSENINTPRIIQHSVDKKYITCGTGKHHSIIVDDEGIMYSFGSGRYGQLGYGNPFTNEKQKHGAVQSFPRQVTPSTAYKKGRDMRITEVACGTTFSVAREVCPDEGIHLFKNLHHIELKLETLRKVYYDSEVMQRAWAEVRQERYKVKQIAEGQMCAWGTGKNGQLGLGKYKLFASSPTAIYRLKDVCITKIAAGMNHVLAVDSTGILYSWGSGKCGKLGHQDFEDRFQPSVVRFFDPYFVETCSAGDNHSAVLTTNRKGLPRAQQIRQVSTFGRGAHGRLGNGSNRNVFNPVAILDWPPSLEGFQFIQIACGGAHTVLLAYKDVPKTLPNPWGVKTQVMAWGYGKNGQLGNGYYQDSFIPVKCILPKCEVIAEISAGRSWSLARTIAGTGYSWGKGLRGQLGQDEDSVFSIVPKKMNTFAAYLELKGGVTHNLCIGTSRKHLNEKATVDSVKVHGHHAYDPIIQNKKLKEVHSDVIYSFDCCRRNLNYSIARSRVRYTCTTCDLASICYVCAQLCHANHDVFEQLHEPVSVDPYHNRLNRMEMLRQNRSELLASLASKQDKRMTALIKESRNKSHKGVGSLMILKAKMKFKKAKLTKRTGRDEVKATSDVPKLYAVLKFLVEKREAARLLKEDRLQLKDKSSSSSSSSRVKSSKKASAAKANVVIAATTANAATHVKRKMLYCHCSIRCNGCKLSATITEEVTTDDDQLHATRYSSSYKYAVQIQTLGRKYIGRCRRYHMLKSLAEVRHEVAEAAYYKYILSPIWFKFRKAVSAINEEYELSTMYIEEDNRRKYDYKYYLQRAMVGMAAVSHGLKLVYGNASAIVPQCRNKKANLLSIDDITLGSDTVTYAFTWCSVRDLQLKMHPLHRLQTQTLADLTRYLPRGGDLREGQCYDKDLSLFTQKYIKTKVTETRRNALVAAYDQQEQVKLQEYERKKREMTKAREAKKKMLSAAAALRKPRKDDDEYDDDDTSANKMKKLPPPREVKYLGYRKEPTTVWTTDDDLPPFNQYTKELQPVVLRRHSISDPHALTGRLKGIREELLLTGYAKRRNSLPLNLQSMHPTERPTCFYVDEVRKSLVMYHKRLQLLKEISDPSYSSMWLHNERKRLKAIKKLYTYAWLNPRLPRVMNDIIADSRRRRTISEPERLAKELHVLFATRNAFSTVCKIGLEDGMPRSRRSFDWGEQCDDSLQINSKLGYSFTSEDAEPPTINTLYKDSILLDSRIDLCGYRMDGSGVTGIDNTSKGRHGGENVLDELLKQADKKTKGTAGATLATTASSSKPTKAAVSVNAKSIQPKMSGMVSKSKATQKQQQQQQSHHQDSAVAIWEEHFTEEGYTYYYNSADGVSVWEYPAGDVQLLQQYQDDASGEWYWYNNVTGESTWM